MDRERATTFTSAAVLLALAAVALLAIDASRKSSTQATAPRAARPAPPPPARPEPAPRTTAAAAARLFAGDWLDYLAGQRPVSSVRAAAPSLLVAFAGSDGGRDPVGPGRQGLRAVRCGPPALRGRRQCRALVAQLPAIRFTLATGDRPHAVALELD